MYPPHQSTRSLTRRGLLAAGAGLAAVPWLSSCSSDGAGTESSGGTGGRSGTTTPTYQPFAGVEPDRPGTADGVSPVFYTYPDPPVDREGFPLPGGEPFTALMQALPPDIAPADNSNYQQMFKTIGTTFEITYGTYANYRDKFQVTMASGDIPDLCQMVTVPQMPALMEKYFTDLSDVLGGDEITKYPGLANIPTPTWRIPTLNGRIWGIAQPRPPAGYVVNTRGDLFAEHGLDPNITLRDGQDFVGLLDQLTDRQRNKFAMGADPLIWLMAVIKTMVGTPNFWAEEGGRFIHEIETEEMKTALSEASKIVRAGYLHPNSFSDPGQNRTWYKSGVTSIYVQSFVGWGADVRNQPDWNVGNIELPKWNGGGAAPIRKTVAGYGAYVAIKKSDDQRLEQLLRFADYVASPFGTQQYLDVNYGVPGYSYRMDGTNPVKINEAPPIPAVTYTGGNSGAVLFGQGERSSVDAQYEYLSRAIPAGSADASEGLYSETAVTKGRAMSVAMNDLQREILQGQKPVGAWDDFVKQWKSQVGDAVAAELAEAAGAG